jgi:two-component system phosphate regulon sensor histidine kinase PhoR
MSKKSIRFIISLMSFALLGVLAMQYYFIKESYSFKSQIFDRVVNEALKNVSLKLEKQEVALFLTKKANKEKLYQQRVNAHREIVLIKQLRNSKKKKNPGLAFARYLRYKQAKADSLFRLQDSTIKSTYPNALVFNDAASVDAVNYNFRIDYEQIQDEYGFSHNVVQKVTKEKPQKSKDGKWKFPAVVDSVRQYLIFDPQVGPLLKVLPRSNYLAHIKETEVQANLNMRKRDKAAKNVKEFLDSAEDKTGNRSILQDIANEYQQVNIPLKNRINPQTTDSLIKIELANSGINLDYNYKISSNNKDSIIFLKEAQQNNNFLPYNTYKTPLFKSDVVRDGGYLTITFPKKNSVIISNMKMILASSGGLLLILLGSFAYTILSILRQKKIAEIKTDFINNMTHEFKTPVATIMIASEALSDPEINQDTNRVSRLANIIYDENKRLGDHIERVLNIARNEDADVEIEQKPIAVNDIISAVADSMRLQLQKRDAELSLNLMAVNDTILGDELHFSNVIFNLLDNAIKYSEINPQIALTTINTGNELLISISDQGIGMSKDQQKKIFEQFYRIPTGNLHNVKGFGLGLSYVSNMLKKMNGSIQVKSEKEKGSTFIIKFILP